MPEPDIIQPLEAQWCEYARALVEAIEVETNPQSIAGIFMAINYVILQCRENELNRPIEIFSRLNLQIERWLNTNEPVLIQYTLGFIREMGGDVENGIDLAREYFENNDSPLKDRFDQIVGELREKELRSAAKN